jgi:uncharacterized protein YcbK (DUF882 family)
VRPELIGLLNALQEDAGVRIEVTSGYRCEPHNAYSWAFTAAETGDERGVTRDSLHRAGAAADFRAPGVRDLKAYRGFEKKLRSLAGRGKVWTKSYGAEEVRDPDNRHDHPYVHVHLLGVPRKAAPPR